MQTALFEMRPGLMQQNSACMLSNGGKIELDKALIYYAAISQQIVISLEEESTLPREIRVYTMDGRSIYNADWLDGSVFWINTGSLVPGVYVVHLETEGEFVSKKVVVLN
jgi:hypothetical protein